MGGGYHPCLRQKAVRTAIVPVAGELRAVRHSKHGDLTTILLWEKLGL